MQWIILIVCVQAFFTPLPANAQPPTETLGMWVWRDDAVTDEAKGRELIAFCQSQGITNILLQIHLEKDAKPLKLEHEDGYRHLLGLAAAANIRIEALDGASEMALAENRRNSLDRLDALLKFQASQPANERFAAIHYDIEPYTLPRWRESLSEARVIAREMLETFVLLRDRVHAEFPDLPVKFDIPAWYDHRTDLAVDFGGSTKILNEHIQDIADEVVLMSYRRKASGPNSVEELGSAELAYAAKTGKKLSLALETIELKEDQSISFFGTPAAQFRDVVLQLFSDLQGKPGFGGVYLHHYDRLKDYLKETDPLFPPAHE